VQTLLGFSRQIMDIQENRFLITGASGLIGSALVRAAQEQAADVVRLVRDRRKPMPNSIYWNYRNTLIAAHPLELEKFGAVFHLSGANIAHRWTDAYRREIVRSRVESTRVLCERKAEDAGIRVVHLRFGVVLDRRGGALGKMLPPFRFGLGGRLGSGRQWMSWISLRDVVRAALFLVEHDELAGCFNFTGPNPVTNRTFTHALAHALHRPAILPVPEFALRAAFGGMADEGLLASCRALPTRLQQAGFTFEHRDIGTTLQALLR
jgi:NAD dependent epimerase/dehydratase family enzyme